MRNIVFILFFVTSCTATKQALFFLLFFIFTSCDPVARHQRLVERYPYVHRNDTTFVKTVDTFVVKKVTKDTFFTVNFDTVFISKDRLKVKLIRVNDTIRLNAECSGDTIYVTKYQPVIRTYSEKSRVKFPWWLVILALILLVLSQVAKYFLKFLK